MQDVPFHPSWQDRLLQGLARLPLSVYLVDLLFALVVLLVINVSVWLVGDLAFDQFDFAVMAFWICFGLIFGHYIRSSALSALRDFRPALPVSEQEFARLRYRFTHLPRRLGWLFTLLGTVFAGYLIQVLPQYVLTRVDHPVVLALAFVFTAFLFSFLFHILWHLVHLLRWIAIFYGMVEEVNLFDLGPLTAFSDLTLRLAMPSILAGVLSYFFNFVVPENPEVAIGAFFVLINFVLASASFFVPLWGMHNRLVEEKRKMAAQNNQRITQSYRALHNSMDAGELDEVPELRAGISALFDFQNAINSTSTWPWETGTIRSFFSALLLPLAIWLIQQFLQRFVAF